MGHRRVLLRDAARGNGVGDEGSRPVEELGGREAKVGSYARVLVRRHGLTFFRHLWRSRERGR